MKAMKSRMLTIIFCSSLLATAQPQNAREQTQFSAEDEAVRKPVPLPVDVMDLLKQDRFVQDTLEGEKLSSDSLPKSWFSGSALRLGPRTDDLIVEANGPLVGANVNSFWVFLAGSHGHRLVLNAPTHNLKVEDHRTNGYRDITLISAVAGRINTTQLRFNGHEYVLYQQKSEVI